MHQENSIVVHNCKISTQKWCHCVSHTRLHFKVQFHNAGKIIVWNSLLVHVVYFSSALQFLICRLENNKEHGKTDNLLTKTRLWFQILFEWYGMVRVLDSQDYRYFVMLIREIYNTGQCFYDPSNICETAASRSQLLFQWQVQHLIFIALRYGYVRVK